MNTDQAPIYILIAAYDVKRLESLLSSRSDGVPFDVDQVHGTPLCAIFTALKAAGTDGEKIAARQIISLVLGELREDSPMINNCNADGMTPLMLAIECGIAEYVDHLLRLGANVNLLVNDQPPLDFAVEKGHRALFRILLSHGADPQIGVDLIELMMLMVDQEDRDLFWTLATQHASLLQSLLAQPNNFRHPNYLDRALGKGCFRIAMDIALYNLPALQGNCSRAFIDNLLRGDPAAWATPGLSNNNQLCDFIVEHLLDCGDNANAVNVLCAFETVNAHGFEPTFKNACTIAAAKNKINFFKQLEQRALVPAFLKGDFGKELLERLLSPGTEDLIICLMELGAQISPPDQRWSERETDLFGRACTLGCRKVVAFILKRAGNLAQRFAMYALVSPMLPCVFENDDVELLDLLLTCCDHPISPRHFAITHLNFKLPKCSSYLLWNLENEDGNLALQDILSAIIRQIESSSDEGRVECARRLILILVNVLLRNNPDVMRLAKHQIRRCATAPEVVSILTSLGANPCELLKISLSGSVEVSPACVEAALQGLLKFVYLVNEFKLQAIKKLAFELLSPLEELFDQLGKYRENETLDDSVNELALELHERLTEWQIIALKNAPAPLFDTALISAISNHSLDELLNEKSVPCSPDIMLFIKHWLSAGGSLPPVSLTSFLTGFHLHMISITPPPDDAMDEEADDAMDDKPDDK